LSIKINGHIYVRLSVSKNKRYSNYLLIAPLQGLHVGCDHNGNNVDIKLNKMGSYKKYSFSYYYI